MASVAPVATKASQSSDAPTPATTVAVEAMSHTWRRARAEAAVTAAASATRRTTSTAGRAVGAPVGERPPRRRRPRPARRRDGSPGPTAGAASG